MAGPGETGGDYPENGGQKPKSKPDGFDGVRERHDEAQRDLNAARNKDQDGQREVQDMGHSAKRRGELSFGLKTGTLSPAGAFESMQLSNVDSRLGDVLYSSASGSANVEYFSTRAAVDLTLREDELFCVVYIALDGGRCNPEEKGDVKKAKALLTPAVKLFRQTSGKGAASVDNVVRQIMTQTGTSLPVDKVKFTLAHVTRTQDQLQIQRVVSKNPEIAKVYFTAVVAGKNPDVAFKAAVESSPELKKQYQEYVKTWEQEQFKEILEPPVLDAIPGATPPDSSQIAEAQRAIPAGVTFNIENGNEGRIQFGSLARDAAIISVNSHPQLVIYDKNADRGFVGPIEPAKAKEAMRGMAIDAYFTEQFQKASTLDSEKDPAKMRDAKLLDVVRKFLPNGGEGQTDKLTDLERGLVENLVRLLVKPDKEFVSIQDKAKFLLRLAADESSDRFVRARKRFNEQSEDLSLSDL